MPQLMRLEDEFWQGEEPQIHTWTTASLVFGRSNRRVVEAFHPINWQFISRDHFQIQQIRVLDTHLYDTITLLTHRSALRIRVNGNILTDSAILSDGSIIEFQMPSHADDGWRSAWRFRYSETPVSLDAPSGPHDGSVGVGNSFLVSTARGW